MFGPGTGPHQVDECVDKQNYLDFVDYYVDFLTSFVEEV